MWLQFNNLPLLWGIGNIAEIAQGFYDTLFWVKRAVPVCKGCTGLFDAV